MDDGRARKLKDDIQNHLLEIEKLSRDLAYAGWSPQIGLYDGEDKKIAYINLGNIQEEDILHVTVRYNLE